VVFDRHTRQHHRYFTPAAMRVRTPRDLRAVLFPAPMLLFFGLIAASLGGLVALLLSREVAVVFVATAITYYLLYELLHLAYHLPNTMRAARLPIVRQLAHLHRVHHRRSSMREVNFNLVLPLFDWLFGTLAWRAGRGPGTLRQDPRRALRALRATHPPEP
jgi:sterol desaturase/sphingolipid hydroxylase (fatty acid hydroxylase superfamily)